jgi:hypothetical protein
LNKTNNNTRENCTVVLQWRASLSPRILNTRFRKVTELALTRPLLCSHPSTPLASINNPSSIE